MKRKARQEPAVGNAEETAVPSERKRQKAEEAPEALSPAWKNKERVLLVSSRGITYRYRHLLLDLGQLLPHSKRDSKLDTKSDRGILNEVADMKGCQSVLFFEARKKKDLYIWLAKAPEGPSVKFLVTNVHTMAELKLSGNHLKGSRPLLSFHKAFDEQPHLQLLKELLSQAFGTPKRHAKSKPFLDHVITFSVAEGRIWLRNYQVVTELGKRGEAAAEGASLIEAGPRACLQPIRIFAGSFGGAVLYENPGYVSPNRVRAAIKLQRAGKYAAKLNAAVRRKAHVIAAQEQPEEPVEGEEAAPRGRGPRVQPNGLAAKAAGLLQTSQAEKAWTRVGDADNPLGTNPSRSTRRRLKAQALAAAEEAGELGGDRNGADDDEDDPDAQSDESAED